MDEQEESQSLGRLPDTVELTPEGGRYYRAMAFWWAFTAITILPTIFMVLVALCNPFWFRDGFFRWVEQTVNRFARWRNYRQYALYLGCDPTYWHTLAGTK
jgi:hypothetical protein